MTHGPARDGVEFTHGAAYLIRAENGCLLKCVSLSLDTLRTGASYPKELHGRHH